MSSDRSAIRLVRDDDALALGVCQSPARLLAARLRRGELSATEVVNAHLERIASHNPALNAVVSLDAARARADAERLDRAFQRGEPRGPLHGVPITLKDGHDVAGLRTTIGAHQFDRVARDDGTIAARLRAAGAIILGHTNVPPGLSDFQSANSIFGRTSNPWDLSRTAGGSSGGAAAAVAAGLTTLDVGSDLAGSMRLPAHFCGVYALKATEHRIPSTGFFRLRQDSSRPIRIFASFGPITRDLDDLELVLRLIAGPDGKDSDVPPVALPPRERLSMKRLRLAIAAELPGVTVSPSVRSRVLSVATAS